MTISLIATVSADAASGSPTITHGLTILPGDVLICSINVNNSLNTTSDNNGSTPFTRDHATENPVSARYTVFSRVCGGSEPSSYSFTASSARWSIVIRQYRGVDAAIWDVAPGAGSVATGNTGDATAEAPSITILTSGACGLVLASADSNTTTYSSINNSYENAVSEAGQQVQATADKLGLSTGATGVTTVTFSAAVSWVAYQVALKPAVESISLLHNDRASRFQNMIVR